MEKMGNNPAVLLAPHKMVKKFSGPGGHFKIWSADLYEIPQEGTAITADELHFAFAATTKGATLARRLLRRNPCPSNQLLQMHLQELAGIDRTLNATPTSVPIYKKLWTNNWEASVGQVLDTHRQGIEMAGEERDYTWEIVSSAQKIV